MSRQDRTEALDPATLEKLTAAVPAKLRAGFALGEYELVEEIGRGSMGLVFRARHAGFGHDVALKVLPATMASDPHACERFLAEARAMARVVHPHVVRVHNVVDSDGTLAIAMERIEGLTLSALLRALRGAGRRPDLDALRHALGSDSQAWEAANYADWVAQIGAEIGDALQAVHEAGLTHRDVKPSNILVDRHGHAHLADFGVVRTADATRTLAQGFVGTLTYAAPEQLRGDAEVGKPADVYGLGATLYELLALAPPADGALGKVLETVEKGRIPPLSARASADTPSQLVQVVHHALQPEPERRYPTAASLASDLRAVRGQRPISIRRPGAVERAMLWARREPARARLAGVVLAAGTVLLVVGGALLTQLPRIRVAQALEHSNRIGDLVGTGRILTTLRVGSAEAEAPLREALALAPDSSIALGVLAIQVASSSGPDAARRLLGEHPDTVAASPALRRLEQTGVDVYRLPPDGSRETMELREDALDCFLSGIAAAMRAREQSTAEATRLAMSEAMRLHERAVLLSEPVPWIFRIELADAAAGSGQEQVALDQLRILEATPLGTTRAASIALRSVMILETLGLHERAFERCRTATFQAAPTKPRVTLEARVLGELGRDAEAVALLELHATDDLFLLDALARAIETSDPERARSLFAEVADRTEALIPGARSRGEHIGGLLEAVHDRRTRAGLEDSGYRARLEAQVDEAPDDWQVRFVLATQLAQRANKLYYSLWHHLPKFLAAYPTATPERLSAMLGRVPLRRELDELRAEIGPLYEELIEAVPFHPQVARNATLWSAFGTVDELGTALERYEIYAAVTPSPTAIPGGLGQLLYRAGRYEDAASALEQGDSLRDRALLGWVQLELGEPRRALATFAGAEQLAAEADPNSELTAVWARHATLGRALATMRSGLRTADASSVDEAESLVRTQRENPDLFGVDALVLAEAALVSGDRDAARARFAAAQRGRALARQLLPFGDQFGFALIAAHNTAYEALSKALAQ